MHGLSETETDELMTSFIGAGLVGEVRAHANRIELPDPADLLSGAVQWKHNPARLDLTLAVTTSTTAYVTSQPEDATGARALLASKVWGLLGGIERPLDLLVPAVHQLALWEHWGRPAAHAFAGGHVLHAGRLEYLRIVREWLRARVAGLS